MHYYAMQELDHVFLGDTPDRLCFDQLSKSVDGNDQESVSSSGLWKGPNISIPHIEWCLTLELAGVSALQKIGMIRKS